MNSKQKGNIGIGLAIAYFCKEGYTVSVPLNDSQDYDLVVDMDSLLNKIQVKYTGEKSSSNYYLVGLRSISGSSRQKYKTVSDTDIDYLFIVTKEYDCYLLSIIEVTQTNQITINKEFSDKYKV